MFLQSHVAHSRGCLPSPLSLDGGWGYSPLLQATGLSPVPLKLTSLTMDRPPPCISSIFFRSLGHVPWFLGDISKWADCPFISSSWPLVWFFIIALFTPSILPIRWPLSFWNSSPSITLSGHSCLGHSLDLVSLQHATPQPPFLNCSSLSRFQSFVTPLGPTISCAVFSTCSCSHLILYPI